MSLANLLLQTLGQAEVGDLWDALRVIRMLAGLRSR